MPRSIVAASLGTFFLITGALAAPTGKWVEVRSPNFIVVSNAGEGKARKTAVEFEQIRSLFRDSLSYVKNSPSPVITIMAVKDEDSMRDLLPEYWAQKGHAHPAGIFLDGGYDQFQVALNLAVHGDNAYESLYHEYYHSVTVPYFPALPVWVAEGMADFFGNSVIGDKNANLGMPNAGLIEELRSKPLIPLATLFKVDHNSPYYNEQNKVSIFYAESWALIHYLMLGDQRAHNPLLGAYLNAVSQGASQGEAAANAFGDLRKLQDNLEKYIGHFTFPIVQVPAPVKVPESSLNTRALSEAEVDAYSGGFLALHRQFEQAEPLLKQSAQLDPKLGLAQRNLAFLHLFRDQRADALASLSGAIALDPQDATTRFLRAQLTFDGVSHTDPQIEADLRQAIALKADFANANGLLAVYLVANNEKLPEAFTFGQKAVLLRPGDVNLQLAFAQVLAGMRRYDDAEKVGRVVLARANDDGIRNEANQILTYLAEARDYDARERQRQEESAARANALAAAARSEQAAARSDQIAGRTDVAPAETLESSADKVSAVRGPATDPNAPVLKRRGGATDVIGVVIQVHCNGNEMDVTAKVPDRAAPLLFHAKDRTRIGYTSNVPAIHEDLDPCSQLRGHTAKIVFTPSAAKWLDGDLVHIEVENTLTTLRARPVSGGDSGHGMQQWRSGSRPQSLTEGWSRGGGLNPGPAVYEFTRHQSAHAESRVCVCGYRQPSALSGSIGSLLFNDLFNAFSPLYLKHIHSRNQTEHNCTARRDFLEMPEVAIVLSWLGRARGGALRTCSTRDRNWSICLFVSEFSSSTRQHRYIRFLSS